MSSLLEQYLEARQISLKEFEALIRQAEKKGLRSFTGPDIEKLGSLYLQCTTQLAQLKTKELEGDLTEHLNELAARAHAILYSQPQIRRVAWGKFFTRTFPGLVARTWVFHLIAFFLLSLGTLVGYQRTQNNPTFFHTLLPGEGSRSPGASKEELYKMLVHGREAGGSFKTFFASHLFFHNTKVGLLSWTAGILLGLPTLLLVFYNGLTLGAMTQVYVAAGLGYDWGWWVLPHGVTELLAIILFSGAGLYLGYSLIDPQGKSRKWVLKERGMETFLIGVGVTPMLFLAALIESFIRQSQLSQTARYAIVVLSALGWLTYFVSGFHYNRLDNFKSR